MSSYTTSKGWLDLTAFIKSVQPIMSSFWCSQSKLPSTEQVTVVSSKEGVVYSYIFLPGYHVEVLHYSKSSTFPRSCEREQVQSVSLWSKYLWGEEKKSSKHNIISLHPLLASHSPSSDITKLSSYMNTENTNSYLMGIIPPIGR